MKLLFSNLRETNLIDFDSKLEDYFDGSNKLIKKINYSNGTIKIAKTGDVASLDILIDFNIDAVSSISLKVFPYDIKIKEKIYITNNQDFDDGDTIFVGEEIDIDNIVYSLLLTSLPINLHQKGEKLTEINGTSIISEKDYNKPKNTDSNSVFDVLKDLDLDS